jgi:hypothetical protein
MPQKTYLNHILCKEHTVHDGKEGKRMERKR